MYIIYYNKAMKITEKKMKEWFPADRRFLHFCAKYYKYSFHSDEVVEEAHFIAIKNVMSLKNREIEFESEQHMVGTVMSTFRFAILNAYKQMSLRDRLSCRPMTDYEYSADSDGGVYNSVLSTLKSDTKEYDNTIELVKDFMDSELNVVERECIRLRYLEQLTVPEVANKLDREPRIVRNAIERGLRKLKKKADEITYIGIEEEVKHGYRDEPVRVVPNIVRSKPLNTNKATTESHTTAMSFLYS
jgi:RNA polymerase sigma factor (sigma-70 family)